jgi:hypothetical protein
MSRQNLKKNGAVETEDPVICTLKHVAQIPTFLHAWPSPQEICRIVSHVFDVLRGKKDELTPNSIHKHISDDPCTGPGVDMTEDFNTTGIPVVLCFEIRSICHCFIIGHGVPSKLLTHVSVPYDTNIIDFLDGVHCDAIVSNKDC